jgi:transcriptional regulator with XRE-family HTH domain
MLPRCERSLRIARDKYLPSRNRGIPVSKEPNTIGGHLRRRRLQLRIFQPEAARRLGVSMVSLSRWECDKVLPTVPHHAGIAGYLGYNPFTRMTEIAMKNPIGNETKVVAFLVPTAVTKAAPRTPASFRGDSLYYATSPLQTSHLLTSRLTLPHFAIDQ